MGIAKVAIIGRPNVGKSSLFNWLVGEKISVVDSVAGVTRDRISFLLDLGGPGPEANFDGFPREVDSDGTESDENEADVSDRTGRDESLRLIELTDTGGIGIVDKDDLSEDVEEQIRYAMESADLILFVTDARTGIAPLDEQIAERLRKLPVKSLLVANKSDDMTQERNAEEFQRFGLGVIPVSAKQRRGRVRLMDEIEQAIEPEVFTRAGDTGSEPVMKIAIVGRRNTGKSTFINTLCHTPRMIASPIPGTTRDCVDVEFEMNSEKFIAIDTPGFQRKKSIGTDLDFYSLTRAQRSIRRADVVFLFFDCSQQISKMDKQLVGMIAERDKPVIFVVNKWDLMEPHMRTGRWGDYLREIFASQQHVPIAFLTGQTGRNAKHLIRQAKKLRRQSRLRVPTPRLNKIITAAMDYNPPPLFHFRKPKIYYAVQADIAPPTIVLFCNMPDAFAPNYQRYLLSVLRDQLPISEVPIRLVLRKRTDEDSADEIDKRRKS